ncbi:hypothetical protein ABW21_db0207458 [Orbilia brochopaga]|nr:hypothetical protein ABW21_db0207458 [Drechslerella brochopaga]
MWPIVIDSLSLHRKKLSLKTMLAATGDLVGAPFARPEVPVLGTAEARFAQRAVADTGGEVVAGASVQSVHFDFRQTGVQTCEERGQVHFDGDTWFVVAAVD